MPNQVQQAVDHAERFNDTIGLFMQSVGVGGRPVGVRGVYDKWIPYLRVQKPTIGLLTEMEAEINLVSQAHAEKASNLGLDYAEKQLGFYEIDEMWGSDTEASLISVTNHAVNSVVSKFNSQKTAAELYIALGYPVEMIVGEGDNTGVFSPSATVKTAISAFLTLLWASTDLLFSSSIEEKYKYEKIAVAALDTKTTECCLKVHGQSQPLKKPFHLTGEPRFADFIKFPPFHWFCRTASALYIPEFDFANVKATLQSAAGVVLAERALGLQVPRSPASGRV